MSEEPDDLDLLAAELVLGVAEEPAVREARRLLARDPGFARRVEDWSRRLMPLLEAVPPVPPPPALWSRIEAALRAREPEPQQLLVRPARPGLLERLGFWRWYGLGATGVAAALAVLVALQPLSVPLAPGPGDQRFVAVLGEGAASPTWLVTVDLAERRLTIRPVAEVQVADRDLELWLIAGAETPPRSLGLLDPEGARALPIEAVLTTGFDEGSALAVSLEPLGGSPTGLPTGPVVYQGSILPISEAP